MNDINKSNKPPENVTVIHRAFSHTNKPVKVLKCVTQIKKRLARTIVVLQMDSARAVECGTSVQRQGFIRKQYFEIVTQRYVVADI